jgi:sterol 3beta-glucosyltransferase
MQMQIVLMASGTRGDVQPLLALGKALDSAGYAVRVVAGANFVSWIESHGLDVYPTVDTEALFRSDLGVRWIESKNQFQQMRMMKKLFDTQADQMVVDSIESTRDAELIIAGFVSEPFMQSVSEARGIPLITAALQPYRATRTGAASMLAPLPRRTSIINRWTGRFAERVVWSMAKSVVNNIRKELNLPPHSARSYLQAARDVPALYAFSSAVVPPTEDTNSTTTGFWFLDEPFELPADITAFLDGGPPPVYVGFGSMASSDPQGTMRMTIEALSRIGQRGILAQGWRKAEMPDVPDHIFLLDSAPHHWLFPRMTAVVHHGGAGTTAAGLRAGKPTLIIPHMADQPFWGRRVHELGVGAKPLSRHKVTADSLASRLQAMLDDPEIQERADRLGQVIRAEHGIENAMAYIQTFIAGRLR